MTHPGALTEPERDRYRAARASADIVRVGNALCFRCILGAIGRKGTFRTYTWDAPRGGFAPRNVACANHAHMVTMAAGPALSAAKAREKREAIKPKAPA